MRILLIEDDENLCNLIMKQLKYQGYLVDCCLTGETALHYALNPVYNLIILDRMLPVLDGINILKAIRSKNLTTHVIFLTAIGDLNSKIEGLDCGADDYLVKPFELDELLARIRALNRRSNEMADLSVVSFSDITLDNNKLELHCKENMVSLTKRETELLDLFIRKNNQVLSREFLLSSIWGPDSDIEMGNIENYVHFLRRRIKKVDSSVEIKTVYGIGYQLKEFDVN